MKKFLLLILIIVGGFSANAQDTTRTPIGHELDYPFVYVRKDTIHGLTYIYNHYPHKMYFSINGGKATLLLRGQVMTVWATNFSLVATRKKYKRTYKI